MMDAIEVLGRAMKLEDEGRKAYSLAAARCKDSETARTFRQLFEDEANHYDYLRKQRESLQAGKGWVKIPGLDKIEPIDVETPIFPKGKKAVETLSSDATDEEALLFGMQVELKSVNLYKKHAEEVDDPDAKDMFKKLASVEMKHFELLMTRHEARFGYGRV